MGGDILRRILLSTRNGLLLFKKGFRRISPISATIPQAMSIAFPISLYSGKRKNSIPIRSHPHHQSPKEVIAIMPLSRNKEWYREMDRTNVRSYSLRVDIIVLMRNSKHYQKIQTHYQYTQHQDAQKHQYEIVAFPF